MSRKTLAFSVISCLVFLTFEEPRAGTYPYTKQPMTREFILEIAHMYSALRWRCDPGNAYGTSIPGAECPYGTVFGWKDDHPYCWGGDDEFYEYLAKMTNGVGAGDKNCTDASPYYSGLVGGTDCSGFASQCFRSGRYSTLSFPQITTEVGWDNLAPGDALLKPGQHIMLVERYRTGTDTAVIYDSGGDADWQVKRRTIPRDETYLGVRYDYTVAMPSILDVLETAPGVVTITWLGASDLGFRIYRSQDAQAWSLVLDETELGQDHDMAVVSGLPVNEISYFRIAAVNVGGESDPSSVYPVRPAGADRPNVLLVDGFDRWVRKSPTHQFHDFLVRYAKALDNVGVGFESVNNFRVTRGEIDLDAYAAVIWMCGDEATAEYSLNYLEIAAIESYLEDSGQLFVTGSEIGWDLVEREPAYDNLEIDESDFFEQYLKAQYLADDANVYSVHGVNGTIFEGLAFGFDDGTHGTYDVEYPDELGAGAGAMVNLVYDGAGNAGVQYTGTFGPGVVAGKVVFLGFPFETIHPETARLDVMQAVMEWFDLAPAAHVLARRGTVNAAVGPVTDVLFLNGSAGDDERVVSVEAGAALTMTLARPPAGPDPAPFALYVWIGEPTDATLSPQPANVGIMCFPTPLAGESPQPKKIWNNIGRFADLGYPSYPSEPAPTTVFAKPSGLANPITLTFQGFILDGGSAANKPASLTNAVILKVAE